MTEDKGFSVKDRRFFSQDSEDSKTTSQEEAPVREKEQPAEANKRKPRQEEEAQQPLPEVNFPTFVFSLSSSALVHFGEIPEPSTGKPAKNLPLAKQTIDILAMLEEKTRGNLTGDEENLLQNILYDLRLRYVKEAP